MVLCRFVDCVEGVSNATMVLRYCVFCAKRQQRAMCFSSSAAGHFFVGLLLQVVFLLKVLRGDHCIFAESDNHRPRLYDATSLGGPCDTIASVTYPRCVTADTARVYIVATGHQIKRCPSASPDAACEVALGCEHSGDGDTEFKLARGGLLGPVARLRYRGHCQQPHPVLRGDRHARAVPHRRRELAPCGGHGRERELRYLGQQQPSRSSLRCGRSKSLLSVNTIGVFSQRGKQKCSPNASLCPAPACFPSNHPSVERLGSVDAFVVANFWSRHHSNPAERDLQRSCSHSWFVCNRLLQVYQRRESTPPQKSCNRSAMLQVSSRGSAWRSRCAPPSSVGWTAVPSP